MTETSDNERGGGFFPFLKSVVAPGIRRGETIALLAAVIVCAVMFLLFAKASPMVLSVAGYAVEAGQVADRDIVADRNVTFVDESATKAKIDELERQVDAVFAVRESPINESLAKFREFRDYFAVQHARGLNPEKLFLVVQERYPGLMTRDDIVLITAYPQPVEAYKAAESQLEKLLSSGITALPRGGLGRFSRDFIQVIRVREGKVVTETIPFARIVTLDTWQDTITVTERDSKNRSLLLPTVKALLRGFVVETCFFDPEQSERRLAIVRKQAETVTRAITKGERLVKKGFVVTDADLEKIKAIGTMGSSLDVAGLSGIVLFFCILVILSVVLLGSLSSGTPLGRNEFILTLGTGSGYFILAVLLSRIGILTVPFGLALMLPTGLLAMLAAILRNQRFAILYSLVLALFLLPILGFVAHSFLFAFLSGVAATLSVRKAEKRIDLIRAGTVLALTQVVLSVSFSLMVNSSPFDTVSAAFWAGFNGFFCAVLTLGFLPLLEQAMNAVTRFRLMELSDLNTPILNRLLTVAPGTYSHSIMVANLAESAAREIGADAVLSRVASYYHDMGKIDTPDHFVENQVSQNLHAELTPKQSAAIIKAHVSSGVEKARAIGLPKAVVDIVAEHHGSGMVLWFWNQAVKSDPEADPFDFTYAGRPPSTRESAVVMLADSVEAAVRTLKKPTADRLAEFIGEIVEEKVREGMLSESALTLNDLDTVKKTFVKILSGHYHSRIEYPKRRETAK